MARLAKLFGRGEAPPRVDRIVVGLGNPGEGYATTRHNVGFQVASRLAKRARAEFAVKSADPRALFVVYDDVDLPLGKIRIRERGGPGTHNGMRSVVGVVGEGFPRLRVGVAPADPTAEIGELVEHVLAPFTADEREAAEAAIARATEAVEVALRDGITRAMEKFNG